MAEKPLGTVDLNDFPGLMEDADPDDIPPGASVVQVNATCIRAGQLIVRGGLRQVLFED